MTQHFCSALSAKFCCYRLLKLWAPSQNETAFTGETLIKSSAVPELVLQRRRSC